MPARTPYALVAVHLTLLALVALLPACTPQGLPEPTQFADLDTAAADDGPIVRIYGETWPILPDTLLHSWTLVKPAGQHTFDRWEVIGLSDLTDTGYVRCNQHSPLYPGNGGTVWVLAELTGPDADDVIQFIQAHAYDYPARNVFNLFAGPNCHTFTQWLSDASGWAIDLPDAAFARDAHVDPL